MRVAIFGRSDPRARAMAALALEYGHIVRILVPDPGPIGELGAYVQVFEGLPEDERVVLRAVSEMDAVVSLLTLTGSKKSPAAQVLLRQMAREGVSRLVDGVAWDFPEPGTVPPPLVRLLGKLRPARAAHARAHAEQVLGSGLDATFVRAPGPSDASSLVRSADLLRRPRRTWTALRRDFVERTVLALTAPAARPRADVASSA